MTGILFLDRWREKTAEINKARSVKYISRYPKKTGKGYNYVYPDSWKKPFKALLECFGIKRKAVEKNYTKHGIKKEFGVDKQTFAAHVLEYFVNKTKWDNLFSKKEMQDKYKKPEQHKAVQERAKAKSAAGSNNKKTNSDKMIVNRSLMRKVWSIYSAEGKRLEAAENGAGQKAAAKGSGDDDKKRLENYYKDSVGAKAIQQVKDGKAHIIDLTQNKESGDGGGNKTGGTVKEDLRLLSGVLETDKSSNVYNAALGEIVVDAGNTGKSGYGIKHIIEQRYKKDGKGIDEITALLPLVISAAKSGKVTRENSRFIEISKDGIIAIIRKEHDERNEKWVLTGFDDWSKQKEAKDAIETVIAKYSYAPEYSSFRKQVGAVIASLKESIPENAEIGNKNHDGNELTEAEKHANRSNAMKGNKNAEKNGSGRNVEPPDDSRNIIAETEAEQALSNKELKDTVFDYARKHFQGKHYINKATQEAIYVNRNGLDEWYSKTKSREQILSLKILDSLLESAKYDAETDDNKERRHISLIKYYSSACEINGKKYTAKITIRLTSDNKNRYYHHFLQDIQIKPESGMLVQTDMQREPPLFSGSAQTIPKPEKKSSGGKADVKKSWCYFDKNGNLYFRKSAFSKSAS